MKILVTGAAGFIGYHVCNQLIKNNHTVIGIDNLNDYYSVDLKLARLEQLGINPKNALDFNEYVSSANTNRFQFVRMNLEDREQLPKLFQKENFTVVCNLAAQAGVRYSLENPEAYIDSNIVGFLNILECCRNFNIQHLVYASSSSVYGLSSSAQFKTTDVTDTPVSLYAASKKSNELMAHTYSHLFGLRTTGLRFFTVYGPWGRPDMAMFLFTEAILKGKTINVFNNGELERDFTYIDDITTGVIKIIEDDHTDTYQPENLYHIYNIGNNRPVKLMTFIDAIEKELGIQPKLNMMDMQPGDVKKTWADISDLRLDYAYSPDTPVEKGIHHFIEWYKSFYGK